MGLKLIRVWKNRPPLLAMSLLDDINERYSVTRHWQFMMTSSNGNIFHVTGLLCGEFTGPRWIPRTKASVAELWCFLWSASGLVNNREAGDLRRYHIHYDVNLMFPQRFALSWHNCMCIAHYEISFSVSSLGLLSPNVIVKYISSCIA